MPRIFILILLLIFAGCDSETLDRDLGPEPRMVPLLPEPPIMNHRLEVQGRLYGQNAQGWLICWERSSAKVIWEVPAEALALSPGRVGEDLITLTWSGHFEVRRPETGTIRWVTPVEDLPLLMWDRYQDFYRLWDSVGRLILLDAKDGHVVYDRLGGGGFRLHPVEKWQETYPWILEATARGGIGQEEPSTTLPPVPEELIKWLVGRGKEPSVLKFYPAGEDLVGFPGAPEDIFVLFSAWKAGVYTFSSPTSPEIPLKISLKDFAGAEMDSNMGYGDIRSTVSWKMKKGEPVLLHLVLINPDQAGQGVLLTVGVK